MTVWLVENGDYWKAVWSGGSRSLGNMAKVSRRQANVRCREIEAELTTNARKVGKAPELSQWLARYRELRHDVKDTTRDTYRECGVYLQAFFHPEDPPIDEVTRADAADWSADLASGKLTDGLNKRALEGDETAANGAGRDWRRPQRATVARHVRAAKMMFQAAADQDRILFNPFDRLNGTPPKPLKDWREISRRETLGILSACPSIGWECLFALCRFAGLRRGEALRLTWPDIKWGTNRFTVNADIAEETTKQSVRVVPIEPAKCPTGLSVILKDAYEQAKDKAGLVCGLSLNNVRRTALSILKKTVGEYSKPFHTLRKCRISELAMHYPQNVIEEWCGHDEEVSRRHYQRVPDELYVPPTSKLDVMGFQNIPQSSPKPSPKASRKPRAA